MGSTLAAHLGPSRRDLFRYAALLTGGAATLNAGSPALVESDRFWPAGGDAQPEQSYEYRYLVDATVLMLGMPMLRRSGVGDARLALFQARSGRLRRLALEFAAASDRARAHGLNRMGWIREVVEERDSTPVHAALLGIMSDSPEQSVRAARGALESSQAAQRFVAIDSALSPGRTRSRVARFDSLPGAALLDARLPEQARRSFQSGACAWRHTEWMETSDGRAPLTFLYAILKAVEANAAVTESSYVFNEDRFQMRLEAAPDKGLALMRGTVVNVTRRLRPCTFQFWMDSSGNLPVRIEFQPRSFLRLTLESTGSRAGGSTKES